MLGRACVAGGEPLLVMLLWLKVVAECALLLAGAFALYQIGVFFIWLREDLTTLFAKIDLLSHGFHG